MMLKENLRRRPKTGIQIVEELVSEVRLNTGSSGADFSKRLDDITGKLAKRIDGLIRYEFLGNWILSETILPLMRGPLTLYAFKFNGPVIIELVGLIERFLIIYISELFHMFPERKLIVDKLLAKKSIDELSEYLQVLGLWNKADHLKIVKMKNTRDGLAHKNLKKISNKLNNGREVSFYKIDLVLSEKDVSSYIFDTIELLYKFSSRYAGKTDRGIIAQKMLEGEIRNQHDLENLFS